MEMKPLKPKRRSCGGKKLKLPLSNQKEMVGVFNGLSVVVHDWSSMNYLYEEGCFGKGSFSKREPNYHIKKDDIPKIVFKQQVKNQNIWKCGFEYVCHQKHFALTKQFELSKRSIQNFLESSLNTSDINSQKSWPQKPKNETDLKHELSFLECHSAEKHVDDRLKSLVDEILQSGESRKPIPSSFKHEDEVLVVKPESNVSLSSVEGIDARLEKEVTLPEENLNLNLEESLYLKSVLGCLTIIDSEKKNLTSNELWEKFKAADKNFVGRYVTYHFFRSKGWIVKSGVKFGGDYLLYKIGPAYYHSNFLVKILNEKKISWRELVVSNRLAETFNKDVVFVKVSYCQKESEDMPFPELLENFIVEATLVNRWFPSKERSSKNADNLL